MLEKAKNLVNDMKDTAERKKEEKAQIKKEQQAEAERLEQERKEAIARLEAERLAEEEAKIQAEKEALMGLSEKELLVEAIMALRGLYSRIEEIEEAYDDLEDTVGSLKRELKAAKTEATRQSLEMATMRLQKK